MQNIEGLKKLHNNKPIFCIGAAPHLTKLNLKLLKGHVTIGCNYLTTAKELELDYCTYIYENRLEALNNINNKKTKYVVDKSLMEKFSGYKNIKSTDVYYINTKFTSPGHAKYFSENLSELAYTGNVMLLSVQLAAWLGGNPIYLIGVDAHYVKKINYFESPLHGSSLDIQSLNKYTFNDLRGWLKRASMFLGKKETKLINAAGQYSKFDLLPKMRFRAATGCPKIAVTSKTFSQDEYLVKTLNRYFSDVKINNKSDKLIDNKLIDFLSDADGVILGTENLNKKIIENLPLLRKVSKYGVGLDNIDFEAAKNSKIDIEYSKGVNSESVAELTITLCIMLLRNIYPSMVLGYKSNKWSKLPGKELSEITLGILGYGYVGEVVAEKFSKLEVARILVYDIIDKPMKSNVEKVTKDYLLYNSDVVTLHVSMQEKNYKMVNKNFISKMKKGAFLINTARGELIDEDELVSAVEANKLSGAALDVYFNEPQINDKIRKCNNILTTCHIAGSSNQAIKNMGWSAVEGMLKLFNRTIT